MYGDLLKQPQPMGAPPPVRTLPPMATPQPSAGPTPGLIHPQQPQSPFPQHPMQPIGPGGPVPTDDAALKVYEAKQEAFLHALAADYAAKKISREDLKKGASYTGTQPYAEWKHENVMHLKAAAKESE